MGNSTTPEARSVSLDESPCDAIPLSAQVVQSERTAARVIEGKAMVITIDDNRMHVLNPVGSRVWELADGRSVEQLVQDIVNEFEVEQPQALTDVMKFLTQLRQLGAVQLLTTEKA